MINAVKLGLGLFLITFALFAPIIAALAIIANVVTPQAGVAAMLSCLFFAAIGTLLVTV